MTLRDVLMAMKPQHLEALYRCAKTRGRAIFGNPRAMMVLREVMEARRCER